MERPAELKIVDVRAGQGRCQLVVDGNGVVVVDAGSDASGRAILAALASNGMGPTDIRRIILTHGDGDHIAAAATLQALSGAEVVAHELEADYVMGRVPPGFPIAKRLFVLLGRRLRRPMIDRRVVGDTLELDGLELVWAPGHTPGHLVVYAADAILAGDAFRTGQQFKATYGAMNVDPSGVRETLRRLARRPVARAFSGHGPPSDRAGERLGALVASLGPEQPT